MSDEHEDIWFPAKRYGWGWGFPVAWQGWVVLLGYGALAVGAAYLFLPEDRVSFYGSLVVLTAALIAILFRKGEEPRWRWGED